MKFTISTHDLRTFNSLLWYANNRCSNNNTHHFFIGECVYHDIDENKLIDFLSYGDDFTFTYKDHEISLKRNRFGNNPIFISSRGEAGSYEEITLEFTNGDLSDDDKALTSGRPETITLP